MTQSNRRLSLGSLSPLRYPGGKSALYPLVSSAIRGNHADGGTYVEPFAGGAGVALAVLFSEQVERIVINDLDPAIYSFWLAATEHERDFSQRIRTAKLNVSEWERQRDIYRSADASDPIELGFATFYLNRTNRSGVLNAGVIGGKLQDGNYRMDVRFNRDTLIERLRVISLYKSRITVLNADGLNVIRTHVGEPCTFVYADPPYFDKASRLYLNAFTMADHVALADCLNSHPNETWMLTYDDVPEIRQLYSGRRLRNVGIRYSVRSVRQARELLVVADAFELDGLDLLDDGEMAAIVPHRIKNQ
jgi:DNA adenine methylase